MEKDINSLLVKYYAGQTNSEEDSTLVRYFQTGANLGDLEAFRSEFIHTEVWQSMEATEEFKGRLMQKFTEPARTHQPKLVSNRNWLRIAAGMLLILIGILLGRVSKPGQIDQGPDMASLQNEIQSLRTMVIVSLFEQPRASERIRAVRMAEELQNPMEDAIDVLIKAINQDPNINVRLASIKALSAFNQVPGVMDALLEALPKQDSPVVQIELLRSFQNLQPAQLENSLLQLLDQPGLDERVKNQIQQMLKSS